MNPKVLIQSLLDSQPPPVSGDYANNIEEEIAIETRDKVRDWYRLQADRDLRG